MDSKMLAIILLIAVIVLVVYFVVIAPLIVDTSNMVPLRGAEEPVDIGGIFDESDDVQPPTIPI